ncbi:anti sigma factor C-terminal domain-containing protein [Bacillus sp. CGMCC 1.16541]|uniref:anti sigma factor C-terminal domain-containing protein n=1 Tax=Bacillus sp. CGMCC 1.16541 TaxID=2185143 RepID=UPI0013A5AED3|nr:anti sigma factor C-terminal domain-containing protein [Bacillus sp. CGMCC 1.16541]
MSNDHEFLPKDTDFEQLVKKARRRSLIKMIVISLIVSVVVVFGLYYVGNFVMLKKMEKETRMDSAWNMIRGANVEEQGTSYNYSALSATTKTKIIKHVNGVPLPWGEREKVFTVFGTSRLVTTDGPSGTGSVDAERIPMYFEGERVIEFYHPKVTYKKVFDDRELLKNVDENDVVEMAFSFDKAYKIEEVEKVFKNDLAWFWVDTFTEERIKEENELNGDDMFPHNSTTIGDRAYGFRYLNSDAKASSQSFISMLDMLKEDGGNYQEQADELYNTLTNGSGKKLEENDVAIIGVVVTGKPEDLQAYNDVPMIRGAALGATTSEY